MPHTVNEDGTVWVGEQQVFVTIRWPLMKASLRCADRATFLAAAPSMGVLLQDEKGSLRPNPIVTVSETGAYTITPGVYENGVEVTPPVQDTRHHVDFWVDLSRLNDLGGTIDPVDDLVQQALQWTLYGVDVTPNSAESGKALNGIELIIPNSPTNGLV